jgi:precorrin-8X/cobalt-precorrin-8 methylmutase
MTTILPIKPAAIETRSFAIIEEEFFEKTGKHPQDFGPEQFAVLRRTIHATGDFSFAETIRFHNDPITMAIAAIKAGKNIITDVNMVATGINKTLLCQWGGQVLCKIADADIARQAAERGTTRAEAALRATLDDQAGILAIGNAPTALLQAITMIEANPSALASIVVIGVPVGFVNAVESKELLNQTAIPHITSLGRKGGSPVAAAIINALVKLAAGLG